MKKFIFLSLLAVLIAGPSSCLSQHQRSQQHKTTLDDIEEAVPDFKIQNAILEEQTNSRRLVAEKQTLYSLENKTEEHHGDYDHNDNHGDEGHGHSELSVHVTYEEIYAIIVFLIATTAAGIVFQFLGMPALVGEIFVGFLLGSPLADFVPYPEAMVLVGEIGLILLLLEAGVEIDVGQLQQTGTRALSIACTGSTLPLLVGFAIATAAGESWKGALAVGAAFSPTSLGVASTALGGGGMLNTPVGQLIVASCVIDDIIALIILAMFEVLVAEDPAIWEFFIPIISAVGFLIVLGGAAVFLWPDLLENKILPRFQEKNREMVVFSIMTFLLLGYLPLLNYTRASYLSGAFLAGMSFSQIPSAHHSFIKHTHQLMIWLLRVFFAASIGFQIPVTKFSDPYVISWGFALYGAVAMKFPLGVYVPSFDQTPHGASFNPRRRDVIVTSLAMSCRGEFSFIIASFGLSAGLIGENLYSAVVWAVLISCVTSPFVLLRMIQYYKDQQKQYMEQMNPLLNKDSRTSDGKMNLHLHISIASRVQWGMQEKFLKKMKELGLEVIDHTTAHGRGVNATVKTDIFVRDTTVNVPLPSIQYQRTELRAVVQASQRFSTSHSTGSLSSTGEKKGPNTSMRMNLSASDLAKLSNEGDLDKPLHDTLCSVQKRWQLIEKREDEVEAALKEIILLDDAKVSVEEWHPWDFAEAVKTIAQDHCGGNASMGFFMGMFDKIDADHGGTVDEDELFAALNGSGVKITREGLATMIAMVDDNNDGVISREEWKNAIDFVLEQEKAQASLVEQQQQHMFPDRRASYISAEMTARPAYGRSGSPPAIEEEKDDQDEEAGLTSVTATSEANNSSSNSSSGGEVFRVGLPIDLENNDGNSDETDKENDELVELYC